MNVEYTAVLERFRAAPHGKLFCLHGTGAVLLSGVFPVRHGPTTSLIG